MLSKRVCESWLYGDPRVYTLAIAGRGVRLAGSAPYEVGCTSGQRQRSRGISHPWAGVALPLCVAWKVLRVGIRFA